MPTGRMQRRLALLARYLNEETFTPATRQRACAYQVQLILRDLDAEPEEERQAICDFLTLLGVGPLGMTTTTPEQ